MTRRHPIPAVAVLLAALALLVADGRALDGGFVVIVHPGVKVTDRSPAAFSRLFLRKVSVWPDGTPARPVDLGGDAALREKFTQAVHKRSIAALRNYWSAQVFSGGLAPPPERPDAASVLAYVRSTPGAVGYVPEGTRLEGVVAVALTE